MGESQHAYLRKIRPLRQSLTRRLEDTRTSIVATKSRSLSKRTGRPIHRGSFATTGRSPGIGVALRLSLMTLDIMRYRFNQESQQACRESSKTRFPFMLFVSFLDFLFANEMKFSVFIESDRKLNLQHHRRRRGKSRIAPALTSPVSPSAAG